LSEKIQKRGTIRTLLRIFPFTKKALPRIILGTVAALAAHMLALSIPGFLKTWSTRSLLPLATKRWPPVP